MEHSGCYKPVSFESDVHGLKEEMIDEETWLEDHYGEEYTEYKRGTSRFL